MNIKVNFIYVLIRNDLNVSVIGIIIASYDPSRTHTIQVETKLVKSFAVVQK